MKIENVENVYVGLAVDEHGNESILAIERDNQWFPLVSSELKLIRKIVKEISEVGGEKTDALKIYRFDRGQEVGIND